MLLCVLRINFSKALLRSYSAVTDWLYEKVYKQFFVPGLEVPSVSQEVKEALMDDRFEHLKMDKHMFQCRLSLWRAAHVNPPDELHFPIPPLARFLPLTVAVWNTLKGGGDTLTRLSDICQERMGVRSENLVACTRIFLNAGLVFHRCNHYVQLTAGSLQRTR